jgi:biopolymer transport protein ExbD
VSHLSFHARKRRQHPDLNVTPLIDVLFILIIFFTLTSTFERVGEMRLEMPDASTSTIPTTEERDHLVDLVAWTDGRIVLDGTTVEPARLEEELQRIRAQDPDSHVMIKAETTVEHGEIVRLLDAVRGAGFSGVGLGTQMKDAARDE